VPASLSSGVIQKDIKTLEITDDVSVAVPLVCAVALLSCPVQLAGVGFVCVHLARRLDHAFINNPFI